MKNKILFVGTGSPNDPDPLEGIDINVLNEKGIIVINPRVIESCHGSPELVANYSAAMQSLVKDGDKVVEVLSGGLSFGLPGIQASQTTYPIISVPLDMVAYTSGFHMPPGHAAVASTGIAMKSPNDVFGVSQRHRAISVALKILEFEGNSVSVMNIGGEYHNKLVEAITKAGLLISSDSAMVLDYNPHSHQINGNQFRLWVDPNQEIISGAYFDIANNSISSKYETLQVNRLDNLMTFAKKIMSLNDPKYRDELLTMKDKKKETYMVRDLLEEIVNMPMYKK